MNPGFIEGILTVPIRFPLIKEGLLDVLCVKTPASSHHEIFEAVAPGTWIILCFC